MKLLQILTFYDAYLNEFNKNKPEIRSLTFNEQISYLLRDGFASGHILSPYLKELGYECMTVVANWTDAQLQWLNENGIKFTDNYYEVAKNQVDYFKPDILYLTDPIIMDSKFVRMLNWRPKLIIGWRAASIPDGTDWGEFDILLSHMSFCRKKALELGARKVEHFIPGHPWFITEIVKDEQKEFDVVFSGQYTEEHLNRNQDLLEVAKAPLSWGGEFSTGFFLQCSNPQEMPAGIAMNNKGPVWAMDMYKSLKRGRIILNAHSDVGMQNEAGNMRLFETTGVGSFLLTDYKDNLSEYFEPGLEIETYKDSKELIEKIYYYLKHPGEREEIALNGQKRCLKDYSMEVRARAFDEIIKKMLTKIIS